MKLRTLITATLIALGSATAVHALQVQTYGQEVESWQLLRDKAFQDRGPAGLVEFDRENALRFYGKDRFRSVRELDLQIRIDRAETDLDTQQRADEARYGFGRGNAAVAPGRGVFQAPGRAAVEAPRSPVWDAPRMRVGEQLPREYYTRQYIVEDWRSHGLSQPRRGAQWVQVGADYMLVNRNGVIQAMERSR